MDGHARVDYQHASLGSNADDDVRKLRHDPDQLARNTGEEPHERRHRRRIALDHERAACPAEAAAANRSRKCAPADRADKRAVPHRISADRPAAVLDHPDALIAGAAGLDGAACRQKVTGDALDERLGLIERPR